MSYIESRDYGHNNSFTRHLSPAIISVGKTSYIYGAKNG